MIENKRLVGIPELRVDLSTIEFDRDGAAKSEVELPQCEGSEYAIVLRPVNVPEVWGWRQPYHWAVDTPDPYYRPSTFNIQDEDESEGTALLRCAFGQTAVAGYAHFALSVVDVNGGTRKLRFVLLYIGEPDIR